MAGNVASGAAAPVKGPQVRFGVTMFLTDRTMSPSDLAVAAEERGFESLYFPEHTHIPVSRHTPPPTGDAELRDEYKRTLDPFVALSFAAAATDRLRVGTGVCVIAQHEPIVTAKAIASLDHLSKGRVVIGIGFGWNEDEIGHHGIAMTERRAVAREHVLAMQALWRADEASFDGSFVSFGPSWSWPKPVQDGGPPVLVGGAPGPILFSHVAEYGDGWIPIGGAGVREALPDLHAAFERAGRDPATARVVPFGTIPDPGKLDYYESIGVDEVVLRLPAAGADRVRAVLDEYAAVLSVRSR
jgi:probable F420-dependent oxidoreductase